MNTTLQSPAGRTSLTPEQLRQWEQDGYLLLKNIIPAETIRRTRRAMARTVDQLLAQLYTEGLIPSEREDLPFETRFAIAGKLANRFGRSWRKGLASPEVFDLHRVPALLDVVEQLCETPGSATAHPIYNARPKLPGQQSTIVPWHQDSSYFGKESARELILTCWVPFVPVDEFNGCLQIAPGTHKCGLLDHHTETGEGKFLEAPHGSFDDKNIVTLRMQPGDAVIFGNLTMHRSLASTAETIRWSIDMRFVKPSETLGNPGWITPGFEWVLRSGSKPETTYQEWMAEMAKQNW